MEEDNPKPFWNFIKTKRQQCFVVAALRSAMGLAATALERATALNNRFKSVFTNEDLNNMPNLGPSNLPTVPDIVIPNKEYKSY